MKAHSAPKIILYGILIVFATCKLWLPHIINRNNTPPEIANMIRIAEEVFPGSKRSLTNDGILFNFNNMNLTMDIKEVVNSGYESSPGDKVKINNTNCIVQKIGHIHRIIFFPEKFKHKCIFSHIDENGAEKDVLIQSHIGEAVKLYANHLESKG